MNTVVEKEEIVELEKANVKTDGANLKDKKKIVKSKKNGEKNSKINVKECQINTESKSKKSLKDKEKNEINEVKKITNKENKKDSKNVVNKVNKKDIKRNPMSFKAEIKKIAGANKVSAQSILQNYMLGRLLERISVSKYNDNFILKGGMLITAMLGVNHRTTMDMDTTIKGFDLTEENAKNILTEICAIDIDDNVTFEFKHIEKIREDDDYNRIQSYVRS